MSESEQVIFLDESGDLGWSFGAPYRKGGSSRFLTVAAISIPKKYKKKDNFFQKNAKD